MKAIIKIVIILLSIISLNAKDIIQVESIDTISIKDNKGKIKAKILFNEKFKNTYNVKGTYKNTKLLSGKSKVEILWTEIKKGAAIITIKKPLKSVLVTSKDIESKSTFKATGDLKSLNEDLNAVSKMPNSKEENSESQADNKYSDSKSKDLSSKDSEYSLGSAGTLSTDTRESAGMTPYNQYNPYTEPLANTTADNTTSSSSACENVINGNTIQFRVLIGTTCTNDGTAVPIETITQGCNSKIDYKDNKVFVSSRKIANKYDSEFLIEDCKIDYNNPAQLQSTTVGCDVVFRKDLLLQVQQEQLFYRFNEEDIKIGGCTDTNTTFDISTFLEYNKECSPLVDYVNKKVYYAYRKVANVNGSLEEIEPCKYEDVAHALESTYDSCEIKDDFTNKISTQQEKLYYMFENEQVFLGECQNSDVIFNHFLTDTTCTPTMIGNDKVVYEKRVAYKDINNIVQYLTKCQPSNEGELPLYEEFCGYEHDFNNHQSYPKIKKWFSDPDTNNKIYLTECLKQPFNFPHKEEFIRWENDDIGLTGTKHVKQFFTDNIYENIDVYLSDDGSDDVSLTPQPYIKSLENLSFVESIGYQRLEKIGDDYVFYSDHNKSIHLDGVLFPIYIDKLLNITNLIKGDIRTDKEGDCYFLANSELITYNECINGDIISSNKTYSIGTSDRSCTENIRTYLHKDCRKWNYFEEIGKYNFITDFLRPDGTYFHQKTKEIFKVIR